MRRHWLSSQLSLRRVCARQWLVSHTLRWSRSLQREARVRDAKSCSRRRCFSRWCSRFLWPSEHGVGGYRAGCPAEATDCLSTVRTKIKETAVQTRSLSGVAGSSFLLAVSAAIQGATSLLRCRRKLLGDSSLLGDGSSVPAVWLWGLSRGESSLSTGKIDREL